MSVSDQARRDNWARYVKRQIEHARVQRGWTVAQVLEAVDIGKTTLYSWINSTWDTDPKAALVEKFCDGLGQPVEDAFRILWPGKFARRAAPEPPAMDPDLELLLRKLQDPNVPEMEKYFIRESLRQLANRIAPTAQPRKRRA